MMLVIKFIILALSVEARYMQALGLEKEMPEDGYHGAGHYWDREKLS